MSLERPDSDDGASLGADITESDEALSEEIDNSTAPEKDEPDQSDIVWENGETTAPRLEDDDNPQKLEYFVKTALLILAVTLFRWLAAGKVGLGDSEAYYYAWSRHLDFSYFDHPPLIAWLIRLSTAYLGDSVFAVRMPSILFSAGVTFLVYLIGARILASGRSGFYGALLFSFGHVFFLGGLAAAPDAALCFFWLLAFLLLYEAVEHENGLLLLFAALSFGLALLSKYNATLFIPPALIFMLSRPAGRRLLLSRRMLIALAVVLAVFAPVIVWNYQHDWASFRFHLIDRHSAAQFSWRNLLIFSGGQLLYYSPLIWLLIVASACWLTFNVFSDRMRAASFFFLFSVPILIFFFVVGAWTPESEPHWSAVAYLPLYAVSGLYLSRYDLRSLSGRVMQVALAFAIFANIGLLVHIMTNPFVDAWPKDSYRPELDISNELYGWDKTADEMTKLMHENRSLAFAVSYHYTMCGQLEFALKGALPVYCANHRRDAFDFFPDSAMPPLGRDGLIVTDNRYNRDPRELYRCAEMEDAGSLEIKRGSKKVRTFRFTICRGFRNIQDEGYKYIAPPSEPVPQPVPPLEAPPSVENPSVVAPLDAPAPSLEAVEPAVAPEPEKITAEKPLEVEAPAEPAPAPVPAEPSEENDDKIPEPEMLEI